MSIAGKMLHTGNFLSTDFIKLEGTVLDTVSELTNINISILNFAGHM